MTGNDPVIAVAGGKNFLSLKQQSPNPLIGKQLQQHRMINTAIDDMHAGDAAFYRIGRATGFGNHAAGNGAVRDKFLGLFDR